MKSITPESLLDIVLLDDVRVSPDGNCAAFVRNSVDAQGNSYKRSIWMKDLTNESSAQPFTSGSKDGSPKFSPDGARLGFIASRGEKAQVFVLSLNGGEAHSVAAHENGIGGFEWSPDGKHLAFTASLREDEREEEDKKAEGKRQKAEEDVGQSEFEKAFEKKQDKEKREYEEKLRFDPRIIRRFPYRTGTSFMEGKWEQVYVTDVPAGFGEEYKTDHKPVRVTESEDNFSLPSWSKDGTALISTHTRQPEGPRWYMYADVIRISLDSLDSLDSRNNDKPERSFTRLTGAGHSCYSPKISPDGKWIAFERFNEDRPGHRNQVLALMPASGGEPIELTARLDRSIENFKWSDDAQHIYFTLLKEGNVQLWRVAIDNNKIEQLTALTHDVQSFDVDASGRIVFIASTAQDPSALYVREIDGTVLCLYKPNRKFLEEHELGEIEEITFASDEFNIQGWLVKPPNFEEGKRYPLCLEMHGGPHVMWSPSFRSIWHEWQTLASKGYVVFACNPRGSDGYGEAFVAANWKDWGPGPMRDVLRGVDAVVQRGFVDEQRLTLTGGSYAGYLAAWIIGHDHRFKAACAQRGVYNLISMRGTTDIPFFNDFESGVTPWEDVQNLWEQSPIAHVPNMQTPLLIEHSEQDFRVPIEQGEQLFAAMKLMNKTVEMVRWPREGHELSRTGEPRHRVERIKRIVEWFDKYAG